MTGAVVHAGERDVRGLLHHGVGRANRGGGPGRGAVRGDVSRGEDRARAGDLRRETAEGGREEDEEEGGKGKKGIRERYRTEDWSRKEATKEIERTRADSKVFA